MSIGARFASSSSTSFVSPIAVLALLIATPAACHRSAASAPSAAPSTIASAAAASASASSSPPAVDLGSPEDRFWQQGAQGDPLELARLADVEGADALGEAAAAAGDDGRRATAIRALAFVDDPTPALATLASIATGSSPELSTLALQTLASVAGVRTQDEEDDPSAWRACADALVSAMPHLHAGPRRDLMLRALLELADRGVIERKAVPDR